MASNRGFFEQCWTPIDRTPDQGESLNPHEDPVPGCSCSNCKPVDYAGRLELLVDTIDRHPLSQRFWEKLLDAGEMHDSKQADYGRDHDPFYNIKQSAEWGIEPWVGALVRMDDKVGRLRSLVADGGELRNEPTEDSLMDIAVYALISLVLYEDARASRPAHVTSLDVAEARS